MRFVHLIVFSIFFFSCNRSKNKEPAPEDSIIYSTDKIAANRSSVHAEPIKTYTETIKSFATTDEFTVSLFETKQTFSYLVKINYQNLEAEDTLKVPNFGQMPSAEIKKGDKRPSCIIGFLDNNKQFRESKLIYFENDKIKVHVLKHYGVFTK